MDYQSRVALIPIHKKDERMLVWKILDQLSENQKKMVILRDINQHSYAQIAEMMRDTWGCASIAPRHALEFARAVERAHGITKGGQHGTESNP